MDILQILICVLSAMSSERSKELFLKQFDQILDGIKNEKTKVCVCG